MRILILSDLHGSLPPLLALAEELAQADLILLAGDITEFGGKEEAAEIIGLLQESGAALAAVAGNCDRAGVRDQLEASGVTVEARCRELTGLLVVGAGGGSRRAGMTPFERSEAELGGALMTGLREAEERGASARLPLVILSHTPPWGSATDLRRQSHVGSPAFRAILDERAPLLWVSGHIHESMAVVREGRSLLVNPGPLHEGHYAVADYLPESGGLSARLLSLA